jgi:uncharacterized protein (DUF849 family)
MESGHVRVGLEDAPFGCEKTNIALVEDAVNSIETCGGELARAAEVRLAASSDKLEAMAAGM